MSTTTNDFSFGTDNTGAMLYTTNADSARQMLHRLFAMRPGDDALNPTCGLDIMSKLYNVKADEERDRAYETDIVNQINTYTDLKCRQAVVLYKGSAVIVRITASLPKGGLVSVAVGTPSGTLQSQIIAQS